MEHDQLEDAVYMWFTDRYSHHTAANDEMLLKKAKGLGKGLTSQTSPTLEVSSIASSRDAGSS